MANLQKNISMFNENYAYVDDSKDTNTRSIRYLIFYFLLFFFISSFILLGVRSVYISANHINPDFINNKSELFNKVIFDDVMNSTAAIGNFIVYLIGFSLAMIFMGKILLKDLKSLRWEKASKFINYLLVGYGLFFLCNMVATLINSILPGEAGNEEGIVQILSSGTLNFVLMAISTIFLAPIVEELVFRKALFTVLNKRLKPIFIIIISSVVFGAIHIIDPTISAIQNFIYGTGEFMDIIIQFAFLFIYSIMGAGLALAYQYSKQNIIPVICLHMLNNFLSILFTVNSFSIF